ncbi:hypothetical protein A2631_03660 [Candidatus Daviesbacteria bacterium RIFCSPHIGHO2_01_FULL_44_29]|uniref:D-alanine--D-alanine ligase n=1 Tax=Candidatus Daviesbacteria bacterium RIFCSPHIGHO2_02_FULL_43_12 TaxID=1797776 RepID=A0A1F5KHN6_9BACT|nr:MAG: hypothetical protein A2631_03660 [Candidatus Daviesbacteria bacterium RIFCSPHIGHO2_01_FULL_44_29]OGE39828.1 MAG: hypothetical protein A3E86_04645 [Candidatus Daviesbacteria bacterium RIFCSPHIGHO2_12_FULL_47_45]OGE40456.1 MAG: hypothetical protein A3D25_00120 [Candidatus Daviesbacteria bacterium RIFCSPHIGHO2_02_FULL_43_12]
MKQKDKVLKILIISGGGSSERKISLWSAKQVKLALRSKGYKVKVFDLRRGTDDLKKLSKSFDVIFPVLHGEEGEGGELQKFLTTLKVPFVGGDWKGFKKGWFKISFKKYCDQENIKTAPWKRINSITLSGVIREVCRFGFPCVFKTSNGGSSREVMVLKSEHDLKLPNFKRLSRSGADLMVEKFLIGIEVTCALLDDRALQLIEIRPPGDGWFDYENKYSGDSEEIPNAPSLNEETKQKVQQIALSIHQDLKLGQYSRIDFIVSSGEPFALEVNTIPGLTANSLFPKAAKAAGIEFPELMQQLVKTARVR